MKVDVEYAIDAADRSAIDNWQCQLLREKFVNAALPRPGVDQGVDALELRLRRGRVRGAVIGVETQGYFNRRAVMPKES